MVKKTDVDIKKTIENCSVFIVIMMFLGMSFLANNSFARFLLIIIAGIGLFIGFEK